MVKKKKIKLNNIKITSFMTCIDDVEYGIVRGGAFQTPTRTDKNDPNCVPQGSFPGC